jgi:hypothetical protein
MAVGADHVALPDLGEDRLPIPVRQDGADAELLVASVVELEHNRVGLSTIETGVGLEVTQEPLGPLDCERPLALASVRDVALLVGRVVLVVIHGPARSAHVVPLPSILSPPIEALGRLGLAAASAPLLVFACHGEHMFASRVDGMSSPDVGSCKKWNATEGGHVAEPQDNETLTDEEIETVRIGSASRPVAATADDGDDSGDTGDDAADVSDTTDTGDDAGDSTDTGDDSAPGA